MSELKAYTYDDMIDGDADTNIEYYPKSEADKVIAELKDKCQMHDFFWEGCGFDKLGFKNSIDVRDYCDELKRQNEDLLPKCRKANRELRRQKYKRCLAMAYVEWLKQMLLCNHPESILFRRADRRERKWKEMAQKFKEAK